MVQPPRGVAAPWTLGNSLLMCLLPHRNLTRMNLRWIHDRKSPSNSYMFSLPSLLSFSRQQHLQHSQEASLWKVGISISWASSLKIQHPFFRLWRRGLGFYQRQSWRPCLKLWRKAHNVLCRLSGAGLDIWKYKQITISNPFFRLIPSQILFLGWQSSTCAKSNPHNISNNSILRLTK